MASGEVGLDWRLRGPGEDGRIWLVRDEQDDLDLGPAAAVRARLAAFCRAAGQDRAMAADGAALAWELEGPDAGGVVLLLWNGAEPDNFRLGHVDPVCASLRSWLDRAGPAPQ